MGKSQLTDVYLNLSVAVSQGGCFYSYTSWYKRIRDGAHVFIFGTLSMSRWGCKCVVECKSIVLYDSCIYGASVYKAAPGRDTVPKLQLIGMVRVQASTICTKAKLRHSQSHAEQPWQCRLPKSPVKKSPWKWVLLHWGQGERGQVANIEMTQKKYENR